MLKLITLNIARDKNLDDIKYNLIHLQKLKDTEAIYDDYSVHILGIDNFKMTENEYRNAINGLPL
jgi:hypothetical protein